MTIPMSRSDAIGLDYSGLPAHYRGGMRRYMEDGILPGDFLQAALRNNLSEAVSRVDNLVSLPLVVEWLWNEAPAPCWGSPAKVKAWLERFRAESP